MEHTSEDCQCEGKKCTKCTEVRCVGNYTKDERLKSKLKSQCRICSGRENKQWRNENHEYNMERKKAWNKANPERVKGMQRRARLKNAERIRQRNRLYYLKNIKRIGEWHRHHRLKNAESRREKYYQDKDRFSLKWKEYYSRNRRYLNQQSINWRKANPRRWAAIQSARRTRKTLAGGSYTVEEWESLKARYGHICLKCGKQEPEIRLCADHVIPVFLGGSSYIDNIQPLCKSCNSSKGIKVIDFRPQNT